MSSQSPPTGDASRRADLNSTTHGDQVPTAIQTIEAFVQSENWPEKVKDAWKRVREAALRLTASPRSIEAETAQGLKDIQQQVQGLTNIVRGIAKPSGPLSYADIAKQGLQDHSSRIRPVPARRARELIIASGNEETGKKQRTGRELVRDINTELDCEAVVAARRLPSGDVLVTFDKEDDKTKWAKDPKVTQAFGTTAKVRTREYTVIAHGIRVAALNVSDQKTAIASLYAQNPKLWGSIEIVRVGWAKKTIVQGKKVAPLHIGIAEPEQANKLIDHGLLFGSELHDCEVFSGDCKITQCFKCYSYGHIVKHCRSVVRCGFCAGPGHVSNDCPSKEDHEKHRCAVCKGGPNHVAWARQCPVRQRQVAAARHAYLVRPTQFQVRTTLHQREKARAASPISLDIDMDFNIERSSTPIAFQASAETVLESDTEGEFVQPKRKRGRPTITSTLQRSAQGSQDIRTAFQIPNITFNESS